MTKLPDPAGGTFDWAGDVDRLLPLTTQLPLDRGLELAVLDCVQAFEDEYFAAQDMPEIASDVADLLPLASPGLRHTDSID